MNTYDRQAAEVRRLVTAAEHRSREKSDRDLKDAFAAEVSRRADHERMCDLGENHQGLCRPRKRRL